MDNHNNKPTKSFAYIVGQVVGGVLVGSLGACLSGLAIAATVKFLTWIF